MHLGIIPDGHRRYARKNNIKDKKAYLKSKERIHDIVEKFKDPDYLENISNIDIDELTIYALSEENLKRDEEELKIFYETIEIYLEELLNEEKYIDKLSRKYGINLEEKELNLHTTTINFITTKEEALPERIKELMEKVENKYQYENGLTVNILMSYNGKKEIIEAVNKSKELTTGKISSNLEVTEIDYIIRTGENPTRECLSGFPIWQSSYSEYYHLDKNFPAVELEDIDESIKHYKKLRRKKGK